MSRGKTESAYDPKLRSVRQPGQLGDWAAVVVIALFIGLCFAWPRVPTRTDEVKSSPKLSFAYVDLAPASYSPLSMRRSFADVATDSDDMTKLPDPPLPKIPNPMAIESSTHPGPVFVLSERDGNASLDLPDDAPYPYAAVSLMSTGMTVTVSKTLKAAGFEFDLPREESTNSVSFTAHLAFADDGKCISMLFDNAPEVDALIVPWREAFMFSHTATNASGTVVVR